MAISTRVFIFDNENIKQILYARYNRLFHGDKNVIDSSSHFSQKTYKNKYLWTPTDIEIQKIKKRIFKTD